VGDRPTRSASRGGGCPATKELATATRAARCMRLHDSLLGFLLCKLPQWLSTAPERLCSARFCAPSALRPPGGPQTLTLLPPAGPSTPQPLLAVPRCASEPANHGAAEDSWPSRDTTTFSPGVCPLEEAEEGAEEGGAGGGEEGCSGREVNWFRLKTSSHTAENDKKTPKLL